MSIYKYGVTPSSIKAHNALTKKSPGAFDTFEAAEEVAHVNREADRDWYYRVEKDLGFWYIEVYDEERNHLGRLGEME